MYIAMKETIIIKPNKAPTIKRTRVAAYARVSIEGEMNQHSFSAQVDYYTSLIRSNPKWENAGIFADYGITGRQTARPGFQGLLKLCDEGKVDMVLTKSISRFCRNTVDLLNTVRRLKDKDINVHFEKENIDSISTEGELMISLMASFAQEESRSISENVRWSVQKRFKEGIPCTYLLYGYKWNGKDYDIIPEQAEIVKEIYSSYLDGKSPGQIASTLEERNISSTRGGKFSYRLVWNILRCEKYTGDSMLQKTYCKDFLTGKRRKNNGEAPRYWAEGTHPVIIPKETFDKVQEEIEKRRELGYRANQSLKLSCFSSKLICSNCGRTFRKRMIGSKGRVTKYYRWKCSTKIEHTASSCDAPNVPDRVLYSLTSDVLEKENFTADEFNASIDHIEVSKPNTLTFSMRDGRRIAKTWLITTHNTKIREEINGKVRNNNTSNID